MRETKRANIGLGRGSPSDVEEGFPVLCIARNLMSEGASGRTKLASPFEHNLHSSPEGFLEYCRSANFLFWSSLLASQFELLRLQNPPLISHSLLRCCRVAVVEFCFFLVAN